MKKRRAYVAGVDESRTAIFEDLMKCVCDINVVWSVSLICYTDQLIDRSATCPLLLPVFHYLISVHNSIPDNQP